MQENNIEKNFDELKSLFSFLVNELKKFKNENTTTAPQLLSFRETMSVLKIEKTKLYSMAGKDIACVKIGSKLLFDVKDIETFIKNKKLETPKIEYNIGDIAGKGKKYISKRNKNLDGRSNETY